MAPISKKTATGPAGKSGTGNLISKKPTGKFGSKQSNSSSFSGKSSNASFGGKNSSPPSFSGKSASTTASSSKIVAKNTNASHFSNNTNLGNKIGGAQSYDGKRATASSYGGLGASSKSSKTFSDLFATATRTPYATPKNNKSSLKFGILWLPTRKRNKMKDSVYNPYDTDRRDAFKERTPSMYNL